MIRCRVLGPPALTVDGADAPPEMLWRKNTALLVYLARSPRQARAREHLCALLWPEKPEASARHSLNEALRNIRRAAGDAIVDADARNVALSPGSVLLDTEELMAALDARDWDLAGELAGGEFMAGFGVPDCSDFEDWLSFERREWRAASVRALAGTAEHLLAHGDLAGGESAARRAQTLDPLSDIAAQAVIRATALRGDRGEALAHFEAFSQTIAEQLAAEPAPETVRLADRVRRERTWRLPDAVSPDAIPDRLELNTRGEELAEAGRVLREARERESPGLFLVEGDAGLGKTRLLEAIASRARLDGVTVLAVRAVVADEAIPGSGIVGLCEGGLVDAPGALAAPAQSISTLCSVSPSFRERCEAEFGSAAEVPSARAFGDVLGAACYEQPVAILVDDAQWLDAQTRSALELVLRDLAGMPLMLVLAADGSGRRLLDEFEAARESSWPVARVVLGRWGDSEIARLVEAVMPEYEEEDSRRLARRIEADSGGIPLLAVELAVAVRDGLDVGDAEGASAWPEAARTLEQTLPADLPSGIRSAIRVNYRRFSAGAQSVLRAASVLGERFTPRYISDVADLPVKDVEDALDEAERRRWLVSEPRGYGFAARIVRTVIAEDMLTPGQRRRLEERLSPD